MLLRAVGEGVGRERIPRVHGSKEMSCLNPRATMAPGNSEKIIQGRAGRLKLPVDWRVVFVWEVGR